jgi:hypothetical protein
MFWANEDGYDDLALNQTELWWKSMAWMPVVRSFSGIAFPGASDESTF